MGSWGTGIYSNDTASDVRDICSEIFPFVSVEEGNQIIFQEFKETIHSQIDDDDYASFWYALADWQWKHGILTDAIREKALELLNRHAGIEDWKESGTPSNVRKRMGILDKLKLQLLSEMPPRKIRKGRLKKPKHKVGDIIIVRSCEAPPVIFERDHWVADCAYTVYLYRDAKLAGNDLLTEWEPPFLGYDKYIALLCVGTQKEPHTQYLPNYLDENSVYAIYDYLSPKKPSLDDLKQCGFLPRLSHDYVDFNHRLHGPSYWIYQFGIESWKDYISERIQLSCPEESIRFWELLSRKPYQSHVDYNYQVSEIFSSYFAHKIYLERNGRRIDNLLSEDVLNPELISHQEADVVYKKITDNFRMPQF